MIDVTRIASLENDNHNQVHSNSMNIYETVLPTTSTVNKITTLPPDVSPPIYEKEWTHNLRQLMMTTMAASSAIDNKSISVIELPLAPPDLVSSTNQSLDYFQQHNPYDKFLASRMTTSDSTRRANMLRRLKDDAAFLY